MTNPATSGTTVICASEEKDTLEETVNSDREENFDLCTPCYTFLVTRIGPDSPYLHRFLIANHVWVSNRI